MCLIQIVIFLFAASLSMMNDGSQGGGVMNGSTLAPLHALLILLLYYSYNPAGCSCPPYTLSSPLRAEQEGMRRRGGSSSYCKAPLLTGGLCVFKHVSEQALCVCVCVCVCVCACGLLGVHGWGKTELSD